MITFEEKEDVKGVFEIKIVLRKKVTTEVLGRSKLIPQCKELPGLWTHTEIF
jgi:hypothetical protein